MPMTNSATNSQPKTKKKSPKPLKTLESPLNIRTLRPPPTCHLKPPTSLEPEAGCLRA